MVYLMVEQQFAKYPWCQRTIRGIFEEVRKLRILAESSRGACVSVIQEIYPGVIINMDELKLALKNMATGVEFYKLPDKIGTRPCSAGVE